MHPQIEALFDEAENRYLKPEELNLISQYVTSLPARLEAYRTLRDQELAIMQQVADQLQATMPQEKVEQLERCIKNAMLMLRYCAMGMLLHDPSFVKDRLVGWVSNSMTAFNTQEIDATLYRLLNQQLTVSLDPKHLSLLQPQLNLAQGLLQQQQAITA
ncbi:hypothetical protein [Pantanalinema sp. GBBB05]|uniref:hypothetical protein n=1 Tax=Pantanalinema sp. GBBB05 TaxID=2604139 RepID=UPI001DD7744D|nr:hypothetical protein [Pantanalinema sp. GBBB05]